MLILNIQNIPVYGTEHVHNRRQKSMINPTLFNIGARAFAIETPAFRYRRVIIYR